MVRRIIDEGSSTQLLLTCAGILVGFYVVVMLMGKRPRCASEQSETNVLLRLLGLGTFGFLISFGLLIGCSGNALPTLDARSGSAVVIVANTVLALGVVGMGLIVPEPR